MRRGRCDELSSGICTLPFTCCDWVKCASGIYCLFWRPHTGLIWRRRGQVPSLPSEDGTGHIISSLQRISWFERMKSRCEDIEERTFYWLSFSPVILSFLFDTISKCFGPCRNRPRPASLPPRDTKCQDTIPHPRHVYVHTSIPQDPSQKTTNEVASLFHHFTSTPTSPWPLYSTITRATVIPDMKTI